MSATVAGHADTCSARFANWRRGLPADRATFELGGFTPSVSYAARFGQDMATLYRAAITDSPGEAG
ncbi:MAG: hypothetical protein ACLP36_08595 [Acidimicrobiales bacterium]